MADVARELLHYETPLLELADTALDYGLRHGQPMPVSVANYPQPLRQPAASFVTLEQRGELRGCIGTLEAHRSLVEDIAHNTFAAAFKDPRFPAVTDQALTQLSVRISVLTPPEPLACQSEAELLRRLRPGVDGLILQEGERRGTFLPAVWEALPEPETFLFQLKRKTGLPGDYWSDTLQVARYTTVCLPTENEP